jgi:L-Ala-D/L-Glu epimerase
VIEWSRERLALRTEFRTSRSAEMAFEVVVVRVTVDGDDAEGFGEGFGEVALAGTWPRDAATVEQDLARLGREGIERWFTDALAHRTDLATVAGLVEQVDARCGARATAPGIELACLDLVGKRTGRQVWELLGLARPPATSLATSVTLGWSPAGDLGDLATVGLARGLQPPVLKLKLGRTARPLVPTVDRYLEQVCDLFPDTVICADANCAWDQAEALALAPVLADHAVDRIEEPLRLDEPLSAHSALRDALGDLGTTQLFADERVGRHAPEELAAVFDGVNLKPPERGGLAATGTLAACYEQLGVRVQIGCIGESSLGISASAQVAAAGGHLADLDSHLLVQDESFDGLGYIAGHGLTLSEQPGHGVRPAPSFLHRLGWAS